MSDEHEIEKVNGSGTHAQAAGQQDEGQGPRPGLPARVAGNDQGATGEQPGSAGGQSSTTMSGGAQPGWHEPEPLHLPEPTYWPAVMALGITLIAWGVVTTWIIAVVGLALFALSLKGWIGEMLHENPEPGFPATTRE